MKTSTGFAAAVVVAGLAALAAGCAAKPLQEPDAGGTGGAGTIQIDAGLDRSLPDAPLFAGRRSFVVTSSLSATDGGAPGVSSHVFTMVVDGDRWTAIAGANGNGAAFPIEPIAGGFHAVAPLSFPVAVGCSGNVRYDDLIFTFDVAGGLLGTGHGQQETFLTDVGTNVAVTMSLTGVVDTLAPTMTLSPSGDLTDPYAPFLVVSSEPLLPGVHPILRAASGDAVTLAALPQGTDFVVEFTKPSVLLRYGESYRVDISGMSDFAGAAAVGVAAGSLEFTTRAAPPLVAADGFESVTETTLGGAEVLSGPGAPIISGARSLYVPPTTMAGAGTQTTQLALRLAVFPGNTVVRFAYRTVNPGAGQTPYFSLASVGGSLTFGSPVVNTTSGTAPATIGQTQVSLGPLLTAEIALPADATGEIVMARIAPRAYCGGPALPPLPGIIIDDLRVE